MEKEKANGAIQIFVRISEFSSTKYVTGENQKECLSTQQRNILYL